MQVYDVMMILVLVAAIVFGAWKGLAWQVASLAAIFVSFFVAMRFREPVSHMFNAEPPWNRLLAMLVLYLATSLVIWLAFGLVRKIIDRVKLKDFDRHAGAVLGALTGVILCVIITLFAVTLLSEDQKKHICGSYSGYYIATLIDKAHGAMPDEVHEVLHPYLHKLDSELEHDHHGPDLHHEPAHSESKPLEIELPAVDVEHTAERLLDAASEHLKSNH